MLVLLIFVQFFLSVILIGIILMQKGKGASMGVSFGAGASETVFGSSRNYAVSCETNLD